MACIKYILHSSNILKYHGVGVAVCHATNKKFASNAKGHGRVFATPGAVHKASFSKRLYSQSLTEKLKLGAYKIGIILPKKYKYSDLEVAAYVILNSVYMKVQHAKLREGGGLEDSFNMWLRVVFIHLWFIFVKLRQEGRDGEIVIQKMTKLLWDDVDKRFGKLEDEVKQRLYVQNQLRENYNMIHTVLMYMDEGILGGDSQLASSLWSLLYESNSYRAEAWHLEAFVHYVRYTIKHIDQMDMDDLILKPQMLEWPIPTGFV